MSDGSPIQDSNHSYTLLLVEDNAADARLIQEAFSPAVADGLRRVSTGEEALDFVHQQGTYADAPQPDLILLDWHLPGTGGREVLAELNTDSDHGHIPVIVLTGSQSESEIYESYEQNANACISKEADPKDFEETLRALEQFWLSAAQLPWASNG